MKKKIILLLPAFFLALSLGACNGKKDDSKQSGDDSSQQPSGDQGGQGGEGSGGQGSGGEGSGGEGSGGEGSGGEGSGGEGSGGEGSGGEGGEGSGGDIVRPEEVDVADVAYAVSFGTKAYELKLNENATLLDNQTAEYSVEHLQFEQGVVVTFYENGTLVGEGIGPDEGDANLVGGAAATGFSTKFACDDAAVYYKLWNDGRSFWVAGDPKLDTIDLTITNYPAGKTAEHYGVHAWGGAAGAKTYEGALSGSTLSVSIPKDATGFLVAAWNGEFNWDTLVFKSADIAVVANQTEYALPDLSTDVTITVTGLNENYANLEYDVYAYFWGSSTASEFRAFTRDGTSGTMQLPADATGALLLRMAKDVAPNWDAKLDQTNDIAIVSGTTSYAFPGVK